MSIGENIKHVIAMKDEAAKKSGRPGEDVLGGSYKASYR